MIFNPLTELVFLPTAGAMLLVLFPRRFDRAFHFIGVLIMALTLGLSLRLAGEFVLGTAELQFIQIVPWIASYGIAYFVGMDGISLILILLTTFLSLLALFSSLNSVTERRKEFVISMLLLETAMIGTFAAQDLFLFYVFWEAMLIPMYILIGVFGGPRRIYATLKFFLFTMGGSVLMLVGILLLYVMHERQFGFYSTALPDLLRISMRSGLQVWLFGAFALAFAIKIPLFPFHTWLPDAHVEAPTAGSVVLAGILLKMGGYGLLRLALPLFPFGAETFAPVLGGVAVIGIIYGAYVAMGQEDIKKLIAYSSVSHMGFVVLGIASLTPVGLNGAMFQMVAHGISTGTLFLLVGMMYERRHTRMIADYGGLGHVAPRFAAVFFLMTLTAIGLPGLCGFVGEFLILAGSFRALALDHPAWFVGLAVVGIILGAVYMLSLYERIFWGTVRFKENETFRDLRWQEVATLAMPIVLAVWLGIQPNLILSRISPSVQSIVSRVRVQSVAELP